MRETIHIHNDVENLVYFKNSCGNTFSSERVILYAMQGANVVRVLYTVEHAQIFYDNNKYIENLKPIYYFSQELYNEKNLN